MASYEIPLISNNQKFNIQLGDTYYKLRLVYRLNAWFLDIMNSAEQGLILGLPLRTGINILEQHQHIIRGALYVLNENVSEVQNFTELGTRVKLFWEDA